MGGKTSDLKPNYLYTARYASNPQQAAVPFRLDEEGKSSPLHFAYTADKHSRSWTPLLWDDQFDGFHQLRVPDVDSAAMQRKLEGGFRLRIEHGKHTTVMLDFVLGGSMVVKGQGQTS